MGIGTTLCFIYNQRFGPPFTDYGARTLAESALSGMVNTNPLAIGFSYPYFMGQLDEPWT